MKFLTNLIEKLFPKKHKQMVRISTPDGYIEIGGKREFVEPLFDELRQNSPQIQEWLQEISENTTHEEFIEACRNGGYTEQEIKDWEDDNLWDDWIYEKK